MFHSSPSDIFKHEYFISAFLILEMFVYQNKYQNKPSYCPLPWGGGGGLGISPLIAWEIGFLLFDIYIHDNEYGSI